MTETEVENKIKELTAGFNGLKDRTVSSISGADYKVKELADFLYKNLAYIQHRLDALEHPNFNDKKQTPSQ